MCLIKRSVHCLTNSLLTVISEEDEAIRAPVWAKLDAELDAPPLPVLELDRVLRGILAPLRV